MNLWGGVKGDILEQLLEPKPHVPEQQVTLNEIINKTSGELIITDSFRRKEGATAMYRVLSEFSPKLFPPKASPPQQPPTISPGI